MKRCWLVARGVVFSVFVIRPLLSRFELQVRGRCRRIVETSSNAGRSFAYAERDRREDAVGNSDGDMRIQQDRNAIMCNVLDIRRRHPGVAPRDRISN